MPDLSSEIKILCSSVRSALEIYLQSEGTTISKLWSPSSNTTLHNSTNSLSESTEKEESSEKSLFKLFPSFLFASTIYLINL